MSKNINILAEINKILKTNHPQKTEKVNYNTKFEDVKEIDSLELAAMVFELEKIYQIIIADEVLMELQTKTVQDLINEIEKLIQVKNE